MLSRTTERALDLMELIVQVRPVKQVRIARDSVPSLVVASDAQVEPTDWPGGGTLIHDPVTGARVGRFL